MQMSMRRRTTKKAKRVISLNGSKRKRANRAQNIQRAVDNEEVVRLDYVKFYTLTTGLSGTVWAYFIEPNNVLQIDPFISSTTPGFASMATKYAEMEPISYSGDIEFAPLKDSTTPATLLDGESLVIHSVTNLGITSGGSAKDLEAPSALARGATRRMLGTAGSGRVIHKFRRTFKSVFGNTTNTDAFRSATNSAPANLSYICFGFTTAGSGTNVVTCSVEVRLSIIVRFYNYVPTLTSVFGQFPKCAACALQDGQPFTYCCSKEGACLVCGWVTLCTKEHPLRDCCNKQPMLKMKPPVCRQSSLKDLAVVNKFT
jgi:hypothetical protein